MNGNTVGRKVFTIYTAFFFRKKRIYEFRVKVGLSFVHLSVTFLVNESPSKPLEVATSNFVAEYVT